MGNAISFRLNPKCESDRKILAWLEAKSSQPGYLNQTELIKQALLSAMESEQRSIREKEITEWMEQAIKSMAEEFTKVVQESSQSVANNMFAGVLGAMAQQMNMGVVPMAPMQMAGVVPNGMAVAVQNMMSNNMPATVTTNVPEPTVPDAWTSFTFELDSEMHFNAEFGYEEKASDSILGNMRWEYEKLGIIPDDEDRERLEKLQGIECSVSAEEADYREHILEMLRENEELHEQVTMLCSMEFLEELEPLESIDDEYSFNMDGEIFAEDGGGGYYAFLEDGSIGYVNFAECECGRIAMTLKEALELELNCAYSWHNYAVERFFADTEYFSKFIYGLEQTGREQYMDAYGDESPEYDKLRDKLAEALELKVVEEARNLVDEILVPFYENVKKEPLFLAADEDDVVLDGLLKTGDEYMHFMTYAEMKQKAVALHLEDLAHGIKVGELENPKRFEAAGLGMIDMFQLDYTDPRGLYCIYSGGWNSPDKKILKEIVPTIDADVYGQYYELLRAVEASIVIKNSKTLYILIKDLIYDTAKSEAHLQYDRENGEIKWVRICSNFIYTDNSSRKWVDDTSYGSCSYMPKSVQDWQELLECIRDKEWFLSIGGRHQIIEDEGIKTEIVQKMRLNIEGSKESRCIELVKMGNGDVKMNKTAEGHNMLWINGDTIGLDVVKVMRRMYGDRLVYPVKDLTPPAIPEYYLVIFTIDDEELDISYEFGDYVLASFSDKADVFVEEIEAELINQFGQIF